MELAQLKCFVTIAETGSFTRAADSLHTSQPAVSYQIKRLEDELGAPLFDRRGRKVALTPEGELFLPAAQTVLLKSDEAVRTLKEHLGIDVGEVRMGCNPTVASHLIPGILEEFRKDYPRVRVEVLEADDLELQQLVQQDLLDFAVATAPGSPQTLDITHLGAEDIVLVVSPQHHLARHRSVVLAELADEDFVQPIYSFNIKAHILDACRAAGFEPKTPYQAGSIEAVKNMARHGLGIAVMPSIALKGAAGDGLTVIKIKGGLIRDLNLITGKERSLSRVARALAERVSTVVSDNMMYPPRTQPGSGRASAKDEPQPSSG